MEEERRAINKKVLAAAIALFVWPMLVIGISLLQLYSLADNDQLSREAAMSQTETISTIVQATLYVAPFSIVAGIVLLTKKLRS